MITENLKIKSYQLIHAFLQAINKNDKAALNKIFSISEEISEEIIENLSGYFGSNFYIEPPPIQKAFEKNSNNRINFEIFEMNDPGTFGVECVLWTKDKPQEPILHAEITGDISNLQLEYKYIGS